MRLPPITVPSAFAEATIAREGEAGRRWLASAPEMIVELCRLWGLEIDGPVLHGYLAMVVPTLRGDEQCVLKLTWPGQAVAQEAAALAAWSGQGAVRMLDSRIERGALLLERLDYTRTLTDLPIEEAIQIAGRLLRRQAVSAPEGVPTLGAASNEIVKSIEHRTAIFGRSLPSGLADLACRLAERLGAGPASDLVNFDLHYADVLAGQREAWLSVDPKVIAGPCEFGAAQLLWTRLEDIESDGGLESCFGLLLEAAELDENLAREWTMVRTVDYWLWALSAGLTEDPRRCSRIAAWLNSALRAQL